MSLNPKRPTIAKLPFCLAGFAVVALAVLLWLHQHRVSVQQLPPSAKDFGHVALVTASREATQRKTPITAKELSTFNSTLESLEPAVAVSIIRDFLATGADAPSGLAFRLAADGSLENAPTLRTFLLDRLSKIDARAAAEIAKEILSQKTSADEWALALRDYARSQTDEVGKTFLKIKLRELLDYEPWRRAPSVGFLESFDVIVYLRATEFTPELAAMVQNRDQPAIAHAAFLTLDRLSQTDPDTVLPQLLSKDDPWMGREDARAGLLARARITEPGGRTLVENYLLDPRIKLAERASFAAAFPNANQFVSRNLLTTPPQMDAGVLAREDQATLAVVEAWLNDPRLSSARSYLETMRKRLQEFTRAGRRF